MTGSFRVAVSVNGIEESVGARLFDRTTRSVSLTEAGRLYLERCQECLQAFDDAQTSVRELSSQPRGTLRVAAPVDLQQLFCGIIGKLLSDNPELKVELSLSNRSVDLVAEGIDVAVRVAPALEGQFVARCLGTTGMICLASPEYLERHGRPKQPSDLKRHRHLLFNEPRLRDTWTFERGKRRVTLQLEPALSSNSGAALVQAAMEGAGIAMIPSLQLGADFTSSRVEPLLRDWKAVPEQRVFAIYPHRRFVSPNVRLFVEALRQEYCLGTSDPFWPRAFGRPPGA